MQYNHPKSTSSKVCLETFSDKYSRKQTDGQRHRVMDADTLIRRLRGTLRRRRRRRETERHSWAADKWDKFTMMHQITTWCIMVNLDGWWNSQNREISRLSFCELAKICCQYLPAADGWFLVASSAFWNAVIFGTKVRLFAKTFP